MINHLQLFLYKEIPLTKDMGLEMVNFNQDSLTTSAPLNCNINDKGSVFGGSSSALMIISAWSLIKLNCQLHDINSDIVIHKNETIWHKAMYQKLYIKARFSSYYDFSEIKLLMQRSKHKRIECLVELQDADGQIYSTMKAKYVIIP